MTENTISIEGDGYELNVRIEIEGDNAKFLSDAEKLKDSIAKAFDEVVSGMRGQLK
jgi:hypothetical protein